MNAKQLKDKQIRDEAENYVKNMVEKCNPLVETYIEKIATIDFSKKSNEENDRVFQEMFSIFLEKDLNLFYEIDYINTHTREIYNNIAITLRERSKTSKKITTFEELSKGLNEKEKNKLQNNFYKKGKTLLNKILKEAANYRFVIDENAKGSVLDENYNKFVDIIYPIVEDENKFLIEYISYILSDIFSDFNNLYIKTTKVLRERVDQKMFGKQFDEVGLKQIDEYLKK